MDGAAGEGGQGAAGAAALDGSPGDSALEGGEPLPPIGTDPFECGSRDVTGATVAPEIITQDTTWSGIVHVTKNLSVRNEATLTIEPGTKIIVGLNVSIGFGWQGSTPTLRALGTPEQPIVFCGEVDRPGYWNSLSLGPSVRDESVLRNVLVADAGANFVLEAVRLETPLTIQGLQVRGAARRGIATVGFTDQSDVLIVKDVAMEPVEALSSAAVGLVPHVDISGNGSNFILVGYDVFEANAKFRNLGLPYIQHGDVDGTTVDGLVVEFEHGVDYIMREDRVLDFGSATVRAIGTAAEPVLFRGRDCPNFCGDPYERGGRLVVGQGSVDSVLEHVTVHQYGHYERRTSTSLEVREAAITIDSGDPVALRNVTITKAQTAGLHFERNAAGLDASSGSVRIGVTTGGVDFKFASIYMQSRTCAEWFTIPTDTVFLVNPRIDVNCYATGVDGTVKDLGVPYSLTRDIVIGSAVTFEAGVTVSMEGSSVDVLDIAVGSNPPSATTGSLFIEGTAEDPVRIVGSGTWHWGAVRVVNGTASINHAEIRGGGGQAAAGTRANVAASVPIVVRNSVIADSASWGLLKSATDNTDYAATNTYEGNASGDIGDLPP